MLTETERLLITELTMDMAAVIRDNSLDEDNRRFVPDEVFETLQEAEETVAFLISRYGKTEGPLLYAVLRKEDEANIGYVQLVPLEGGRWEVGYHIARPYTGRGYAAQAVQAFLPVITRQTGVDTVYGICLAENRASLRVLEKCGFTLLYEGLGEYQGQTEQIVSMCRQMKGSTADGQNT